MKQSDFESEPRHIRASTICTACGLFLVSLIPACYGAIDDCGAIDATHAGACGDGSDVETTAPRVVSISPANEATGVTSNTQIEITFRERMNTGSVADALKVSYFSPGDLSPRWDETGKVLTVTPQEASLYTEGTTPASTPARTYHVTLSEVAQDLPGNTLPAFRSSFSTLRRLSLSIGSESVANHDTYGPAVNGSPTFCPEFEPMRVGD